MAEPITICKGATLSAEQIEAVGKALAELIKDPNAPREVHLKVTLHVHREYPKTLYKGKESRTVADKDTEAAAAKDGFGPYDHKAFTAKEA